MYRPRLSLRIPLGLFSISISALLFAFATAPRATAATEARLLRVSCEIKGNAVEASLYFDEIPDEYGLQSIDQLPSRRFEIFLEATTADQAVLEKKIAASSPCTIRLKPIGTDLFVQLETEEETTATLRVVSSKEAIRILFTFKPIVPSSPEPPPVPSLPSGNGASEIFGPPEPPGLRDRKEETSLGGADNVPVNVPPPAWSSRSRPSSGMARKLLVSTFLLGSLAAGGFSWYATQEAEKSFKAFKSAQVNSAKEQQLEADTKKWQRNSRYGLIGAGGGLALAALAFLLLPGDETHVSALGTWPRLELATLPSPKAPEIAATLRW